MKKILLSLALIVLTTGSTIAVTRAYFNDTKVLGDNTFTIGKVVIGEKWNLPLSFSNLIPGAQQKQDGSVKYTGTIPADIYIGMADQESTVQGRLYDPPTANAPEKSYAEFAIFDKDTNSYILGWTPVGQLFTGWTKLASNVSPDQWKNFTVQIRLYSDIGNEKQGGVTKSKLVIYAVQAGGTTPIALPWTFFNQASSL